MRWNPSGRVCGRKRRMNSSALKVMLVLGLVVMAIVLPTEADVSLVQAHEAAVGNSDAMGVAAQ